MKITRLLLLGFDAMDYNIALNFLPKLGFNVKPLYAPVPVTAPSWTSIHTGKTMEEHGVNEMWKPAGDTKNRFFWEILNEKGYTCELMNVPATYPPRPVNKYIVCGFPMPIGHGCYTHPPELMKRLSNNFREKLDIVFWDPEMNTNWFGKIKHGMGPRAVLAKAKQDSNAVVDKFLELHTGSDLAYLQLSFIDRVCSHLYRDYYTQMYGLASEIIRRVELKISPDRVMIVSDHGNGWFYGTHSRFGTLGTKNVRVDKRFPEVTDVFHLVLKQF